MHLEYLGISYDKYFFAILFLILMDCLLPADREMVRIEANRVESAISRRRRRVFRFGLLLSVGTQSESLLHPYGSISPASTENIPLDARSLRIHSGKFNLNSYSDEQYLHDCAFLCTDICECAMQCPGLAVEQSVPSIASILLLLVVLYYVFFCGHAPGMTWKPIFLRGA